MGKKKHKGTRERSQSSKQARVPLSPETVKGLNEQFRRFQEKFGRAPGRDDPIFFDPSSDVPRPIVDEVLDQHMLEAMHQAGVRRAIIYAYQKTGRLVTSENKKRLTKAELKKWTDAVDEWYAAHPGEEDQEPR